MLPTTNQLVHSVHQLIGRWRKCFFPVGNWQKKGPFMDLGISHLLGRSFIKLNNMNKIDSDGVLTSHRMRKRPPPRQRAGEAARAGTGRD